MARLRPSGLAAAAATSSVWLAACGAGEPPGPAAAARAPAPRGLHVSGNRLLDRAGRRVQFHGVNRAGTEYACVQGWGIFDGPSSEASVRAIARWRVNAVRLPLNEHCWLGINGVKHAYSGARYRRAIVRYVGLLRRHGIYAELSLMWAAPGRRHSTYQLAAPDADHAPAMWRSLARTFRHNGAVVLAPWGETTVNAGCFLRGGGASCGAAFGPSSKTYRVAGMQQAVTVMRSAGYRGVIAVPGLSYANDLSQWLSHRPRDPRGQLVAEAHVYGKNTCDSPRCLDATMAPVARRVPLILGETGETYDASDCGHDRIARIVGWADAHKVGYQAWTWDTWDNCSVLIRDYAGSPNGEYGNWIRRHYAATRGAARRIPRP
jgi:endoglucanase